MVRHWAGGFVVNSRGGLRVCADRPGDPATVRCIMKILDVPQSGRAGVYVSVRTRYGLVRRRYAIPTDRRSRSISRRASMYCAAVTAAANWSRPRVHGW